MFIYPGRAPADFAFTTVGEAFDVLPGTVLYMDVQCPACTRPLKEGPCILVAIGIAPENQRNDDGYTNVQCIPIHTRCLSNGGGPTHGIEVRVTYNGKDLLVADSLTLHLSNKYAHGGDWHHIAGVPLVLNGKESPLQVEIRAVDIYETERLEGR